MFLLEMRWLVIFLASSASSQFSRFFFLDWSDLPLPQGRGQLITATHRIVAAKRLALTVMVLHDPLYACCAPAR